MTRHRISRARVRYVIETTATIIRQPAPVDSPVRDERIVFLGPDVGGVLLEVMAVETERGLLVIHAMKLRKQYARHVPGASDDES